MEKSKKEIDIHRIFWYLVIFSIIGLIIETLFARVTMGIWQSRKGLIWGPFCPVYGVGATLLIIALYHFKGSYFKLFLYGGILGDVAEYVMSYVLECFYGIRFWEYPTADLNGRICLIYTIFWGILAIILLKIAKPCIDKVIDKIPKKANKLLEIGISIFIVIDVIATVWGITAYQNRGKAKYYQTPIEINTQEMSISKKIQYEIENKLFSDATMRQTFPNLRFLDNHRKEVYICDVLR